MTFAAVFVALLKVLFALIFMLNFAAIGTWADRRQSAMLQHRVGPNRAVAYLPSRAVQVLLFLPAVILAALIAVPAWWEPALLERLPSLNLNPDRFLRIADAVGSIGYGKMLTGVEIAILVAWFSLLILGNRVRRDGASNEFEEAVGTVDPRNYFYAGVVGHLLAVPLLRLVPKSWYGISLPRGAAEKAAAINQFQVEHAPHITWGPTLFGTLAALVILVAAAYAASKVPDGKIGLRLAGLLHAAADAMKMVWKEDLRPRNADKLLFALAPLMAMIPALVTIAVIPFGGTLCFKDKLGNGELDFADLSTIAGAVQRSGECAAGYLPVPLQVADLNVGLLYIFAIAGTGIIGAAIAGWASDSKFALLGGLRATSQMVSYEVALGLAIVPMLMVTGSVGMRAIVDWQAENAWGIFVNPLAFILFLTAVIAETKRVPFDQPEGESEIVAGYFLEYSGMKWGMFMTGEYAEFIFSSVLLVTLFFGGYHLPFLHADGITIEMGKEVFYQLKMNHLSVSIIHVIAFVAKTAFVAWLHVFVRWTLPRFRYDQLMKLGWTRLLPLALANIVLTAVVLLAIQDSRGAQNVADILCDVSQALVAVLGILGTGAMIAGLLEPTKDRETVTSTSAQFTADRGGVRPSEMQA